MLGIFNVVVFFLLLAFSIDLSLMTGSPIPLGVGVALMVWRVARTPEITNRVSSNMNSRVHRFLRDLGIALGPALILLGVSDYAAWNPYTGSRGFPFSVTYVIPGCFGPGGPLGCLAYDPLQVVLDYLFWLGLSVVILTLAGWVRTRGTLGQVSGNSLRNPHPRRELVNSIPQRLDFSSLPTKTIPYKN